MEPFYFREDPSGWSAPALQQTSKNQIKAGTKNDCNRETLQSDKIVADSIPTSTLYAHYLQHAKHCHKRNYVQNYINITINITITITINIDIDIDINININININIYL